MNADARRILLLATCLLALPLAACGRATEAQSLSSSTEPARTAIQRGEALVTTGLCHDCHTPKKFGPKGPEPDMTRMLSGHPEDLKVTAPFVPTPGSTWTSATNDHLTAWSGPWGVSFTANLTPDPMTGLRSGVWTEELFIKALRTGKHMGTARDILPPMPWQFIGRLSDDDLKAIWVYLGSIPPVLNHVPDPVSPAGAPTQ